MPIEDDVLVATPHNLNAEQVSEGIPPTSCAVLYGPHPGRNGEISYISNKRSKQRNFELHISSRPKPRPLKLKNFTLVFRGYVFWSIFWRLKF